MSSLDSGNPSLPHHPWKARPSDSIRESPAKNMLTDVSPSTMTRSLISLLARSAGSILRASRGGGHFQEGSWV
ncbi:hypothetical protein PC116_g24131 [Phytophthora cactorum]|uniref:Uncharacterized protein n=1 Tax=Phytophthora cactorum TaxID=29920 RepID=A0A8T1F693_9STRA|nr:hypothetical protein PC112_g20074 [Phytophthora cactorum]KAG2801920.1 hypothetical protein PC111_g19333 [Phytophthora cactorum]KAG2880701.1 hypothetical protein PC114_g21942 [Phytophthora cactorum]KAG2901169.1 hypothetical protein PC117_g21788 [Phytophthora cactorum]KAG2965430.1 hypothetical protein PC118_g19754 [Phytophthora cactorum]